MAKTGKYSMKAQKIAYNPKTRMTLELDKANDDCYIFDSTHEYLVYKSLTVNVEHKVIVHPYIEHLNWHIDFMLIDPYKKGLSGWMALFPHRLNKGKYLYVDAKGIITNEVVKRIQSFSPRIQQTILLVTKKEQDCGMIGKTPVLPFKYICQDFLHTVKTKKLDPGQYLTRRKGAKNWA